MSSRCVIYPALLATVALVAGCGGSSNSASDAAGVSAVATTTQVADLVREVGGERVDLTQILQPNTDPHEYEARPSDIEAFVNADLVFRSGGDLDDWVTQVLDDSGSDAEVVDLSTDLPVQLEGGAHEHEGHEGEEHEGEEHKDEGHEGEEHKDEGHEGEEHAEEADTEGEEVDPHWWHDPTNAEAAVDRVSEALSEVDSAQSETFEANASRFSSDIVAFDEQAASCLASIPVERRKMVTDHDAFSYLASHYDIEVVGTVIPAITTKAQPSAGDLAELEDAIKTEDVRAVFPESSVSPKLAEAVASDTGASTDLVLYGDTLGPESSEAATYLEMMESNVDNIHKGLSDGGKGCGFGPGAG